MKQWNFDIRIDPEDGNINILSVDSETGEVIKYLGFVGPKNLHLTPNAAPMDYDPMGYGYDKTGCIKLKNMDE